MNGNDLAYPVLDRDSTPNNSYQIGLTKRELFAAMALQGLLTRPFTQSMQNEKDAAERAVSAADALIDSLSSGSNHS